MSYVAVYFLCVLSGVFGLLLGALIQSVSDAEKKDEHRDYY